jgi:putative DNA primase/helicase
MLSARQVAAALGGKVIGRNSVACPGPGHSPRDRSLSVKLTSDGFIVHSHAGDDWRECAEYVRSKLGLPPWQPGGGAKARPPTIRPPVNDEGKHMHPRPRTEDNDARVRPAQDIWDKAGDPRGTLAERYLREHRFLKLPDDLAGRVLRFHPDTPWKDNDTGIVLRVPALIVAFRNIADDELTAVHRIRLDPDTADKIERRMLGIVKDAAVKLDPRTTDRLVIGEGVETGMAAREYDLHPVWALGSVAAITWFPVLDGVRKLSILGETGRPSEDAIRICNRRWRRAGRRTEAIYPTVGDDINAGIILTQRAAQNV